ncbi:MAG: hypothetical protein LOY03_10215 [Cyclobacteriaceae bacterium]|nr:hypothetical protein [Cyclobacteriaceae bacterium]
MIVRKVDNQFNRTVGHDGLCQVGAGIGVEVATPVTADVFPQVIRWGVFLYCDFGHETS